MLITLYKREQLYSNLLIKFIVTINTIITIKKNFKFNFSFVYLNMLTTFKKLNDFKLLSYFISKNCFSLSKSLGWILSLIPPVHSNTLVKEDMISFSKYCNFPDLIYVLNLYFMDIVKDCYCYKFFHLVVLIKIQFSWKLYFL
jgi:hypothetical protein